jgi:hypothetical protein
MKGSVRISRHPLQSSAEVKKIPASGFIAWSLSTESTFTVLSILSRCRNNFEITKKIQNGQIFQKCISLQIKFSIVFMLLERQASLDCQKQPQIKFMSWYHASITADSKIRLDNLIMCVTASFANLLHHHALYTKKVGSCNLIAQWQTDVFKCS